MRQPVIVDSVRTAIGRMGGTLKDELVDFLAAKVIREIIQRNNEELQVDEVILGQAKQSTDSAN